MKPTEASAEAKGTLDYLADVRLARKANLFEGTVKGDKYDYLAEAARETGEALDEMVSMMAQWGEPDVRVIGHPDPYEFAMRVARRIRTAYERTHPGLKIEDPDYATHIGFLKHIWRVIGSISTQENTLDKTPEGEVQELQERGELW